MFTGAVEPSGADRVDKILVCWKIANSRTGFSTEISQYEMVIQRMWQVLEVVEAPARLALLTYMEADTPVLEGQGEGAGVQVIRAVRAMREVAQAPQHITVSR